VNKPTVLHAAALLVLDLRPCDRVLSTFRELHWLPIVQRIDYKLCLLVYKSSLGLAPAYVTNMLTPAADVSPLFTLRAATKGNYVVPRTKNLPNKREVPIFTRYGNMKGVPKRRKWSGLGRLGVTQGH